MYRFIEISSYNIKGHALPARQSVSFRRMVKNRIADYRTFSPMVSSQILIVSFNNVIANSLHNLFDNRLYKKSTVIPSKLLWICVVWWSRGESNFSGRSLLFAFPFHGGNKHPTRIGSFIMRGMGKAYHTHVLRLNHTRARVSGTPGADGRLIRQPGQQ